MTIIALALLSFPATAAHRRSTDGDLPHDNTSHIAHTDTFVDHRGPYRVPGWAGHDNKGGDITFASVSDEFHTDLVVMHIEIPGTSNAGYYRLGLNVQRANDGAYVIDRWEGPYQVPSWFGHHNEGGGVAVGHLKNDNSNDLVIFHVEKRAGEQTGYYRVGFDLDTKGRVRGGWSPIFLVPGWFGHSIEGSGITLAGIRTDASWDLVVTQVDDPLQGNGMFYRVGFHIGTDGKVRGGWTGAIRIPGWVGYYTDGASIEVYDTNENGMQDLVIMHIDNPAKQKFMFYRIGYNLNAHGEVTGGWSTIRSIPRKLGELYQGGGVAMTHFIDGWLTMATFYNQNTSSTNGGYIVYSSEHEWL